MSSVATRSRFPRLAKRRHGAFAQTETAPEVGSEPTLGAVMVNASLKRAGDQFGTVAFVFAAPFWMPRRKSKAAMSCLSLAGSGGM